MNNDFNLTDQILDILDSLPKKQKKLADYVLKNQKQCAFMTSTNLSKASDVSESTVIRFPSYLNFSGYPEFQRNLQESLKNELSALDKFSIDKIEDSHLPYEDVFESEVNIINRTLKDISPETFYEVIDAISFSDNLFTIGFQGSQCLASYSGYNLSKIHSNVNIIDEWNERWFNKISDLKNNSVAILFAFPRYPLNTLTIAKLIKENNGRLIVITDSIISPVAQFADHLFIIPVKKAFFIDHLSAVMCLLNALMFTLAHKDTNKTEKNLKRFEDFSNANNIFIR